MSLIAVLVSVFLSFLAQPNAFYAYGNPAAGAISLIPLFWALRRQRAPRDQGLVLALFLTLSSPLQYFWLSSFQDYSLWTLGGVTLGFAFYGLVFGPVLSLALRQAPPIGPLLGGVVWSVYEFFRSNGFFGFPWGNIPYPFAFWAPLAQGADWGGLPWLSFLLASGMALAERALEQPWEGPRGQDWGRAVVAWSLVMLIHFGYSAWTTEVPLVKRGEVEVLLIQQNADPWIRDQELPGLRTSVRLSEEGLARHPGTELVIWSENSIRRPLQFGDFYERQPAERPLFSLIREAPGRPWWLFGNPFIADFEGRRIHNAAVLMDPQARIHGVYAKNHLVPFAEIIPFFELEAVQNFFRQALRLYATWVPGERIHPLVLPREEGDLRLGVLICFEDAFPYISRSLYYQGAQLLLVLSNDSWSKTDSAQIQHQIVAHFRSLETRLPLVRSTNSGFTAVTDPRGRTVAGPLPFFTSAYLHHRVALETLPHPTLVMLLGDWAGWTFWWITLAWCWTFSLRFRKGQWC